MKATYRSLPSVDRVLQQLHPAVEAEAWPHELTLEAVRAVLDACRQEIAAGGPVAPPEAIAARAEQQVRTWLRPTLRPAINASGVILHTNLGRAPLSAAALEAVRAVSHSYCNLEYDLEAGQRGSRYAHARALLCRLTGAEAALAVNNNAAAVLLALSAQARGREVLVSRGQAVEIGGGFRVPDVLRQSGAALVEVGTTNRTYARDYQEAITPQTAALLRVHRSNFGLVGFVHDVTLAELVNLGHARGLVVIDDLGSGALLDTGAYGLVHEPTVQESVQAGADLVCFSGDKLLGGPQAGLIVGRSDLVADLERHPLARAVRLDKMALAALEATLRHYLLGEAVREVPVWRAVAQPLEEVGRRARRWQRALAARGRPARVVRSETAVGGGALPGQALPTWAVELTGLPAPLETVARLRAGDPPIVARVEGDCVVLDPRTVLPEEEKVLLAAVAALPS